MVKCLDMKMISISDYLMVKCVTLYLEIKMESHLELMLEQIWPL